MGGWVGVGGGGWVEGGVEGQHAGVKQRKRGGVRAQWSAWQSRWLQQPLAAVFLMPVECEGGVGNHGCDCKLWVAPACAIGGVSDMLPSRMGLRCSLTQ